MGFAGREAGFCVDFVKRGRPGAIVGVRFCDLPMVFAGGD